ncbi:MAG: hypothetical protein ACRD0U_08940 [Acidimicrobiales bacterium]
MCMNCLSTSETIVAQGALAVALAHKPIHVLLAAAGLVAPPDERRRDARTVAFLRSLDLDPVEILGAQVVTRAEQWVPQTSAPTGWARRTVSPTLLTA